MAGDDHGQAVGAGDAVGLSEPDRVCPEPGIYHGVSFADYKAWDAMNASTLVEGFHGGVVDASRLEAFISGRRTKAETKDLRFGRALHARILEPELFDREWITSKPCEAALQSGKNKGEPCGLTAAYVSPDDDGCDRWYCGKHKSDVYREPQNYVTTEERERIERCRARAYKNREVQLLHKFPGSEVSIVFDLFGVRCKGRLDKLCDDGTNIIIADPKKVAQDQLTRDGFRRTIYNLKYYIKAAFYCDGVKSLMKRTPSFCWIPIEDDEPFNVAAFYMDEATYNAGRLDCFHLLSAYKRGMETGEWPGAFQDAEECGLSEWILKQYKGQEIG